VVVAALSGRPTACVGGDREIGLFARVSQRRIHELTHGVDGLCFSDEVAALKSWLGQN
jgi:hypothetical protein